MTNVKRVLYRSFKAKTWSQNLYQNKARNYKIVEKNLIL